MTRKHFQAFADKISELENPADAIKMALLCVEIFKADNPRFQASKFIVACGLDLTDTVFGAVL